MSIKKLKLNGLKIQSFVTSLDSKTEKQVKAGVPGTHYNCTMIENCGSGDACTEFCTFVPCTDSPDCPTMIE